MENINEHDMTKNMLDRLRNPQAPNSLNESVQPKEGEGEMEQLTEHDITKKMLDVFRNQPINEHVASNGTLLTENTTEDVVKVEDDELGEEAAKLRDVVGGVDLKLYEVYPQAQNVVMVGVLDNGIEFKFSKKEGAPYINVSNLRLDADSVDVIKKLQGYYVNWTQHWAEKIGEYSNSV